MPEKEKREKKALEMRTVEVTMEVRAEGDGEDGHIHGRPIVIGSRTDLGWFDEIIDSGALDETDLNDVRFCLNHDTRYVYARSRRNNPNSTMRLSKDPTGLDVDAFLDLSIPKHQDLYGMIRRGDIDKMSFMFSIEDETWEDLESDHPYRHITKIGTVVEVSAVTFPAYNSTSVEISERSKEALESARSALESARQQREQAPEGVDTTKQLELEKAKLDLLRRKSK